MLSVEIKVYTVIGVDNDFDDKTMIRNEYLHGETAIRVDNDCGDIYR